MWCCNWGFLVRRLIAWCLGLPVIGAYNMLLCLLLDSTEDKLQIGAHEFVKFNLGCGLVINSQPDFFPGEISVVEKTDYYLKAR